MAVIKIIIGYLIAVAVTTSVGSALQSHLVARELIHAGGAVPVDVQLSMMHSDLLSFGPQFGAIVAIALAVGFIAAAVLKRILKPLAPIAYPLAGALAIAAALVVLPIILKLDGITPLAGSRGALGFAFQALAGAAGGLAFALVAGGKRA
ncbi:MAG: hypothetical protein ACKVS5_08350 [Parvularculaceae bacterium]